jgi:hypothetical protein
VRCRLAMRASASRLDASWRRVHLAPLTNQVKQGGVWFTLCRRCLRELYLQQLEPINNKQSRTVVLWRFGERAGSKSTRYYPPPPRAPLLLLRGGGAGPPGPHSCYWGAPPPAPPPWEPGSERRLPVRGVCGVWRKRKPQAASRSVTALHIDACIYISSTRRGATWLLGLSLATGFGL